MRMRDDSEQMKVPNSLATDFGAPFEELISRYATKKKLLSKPEDIHSVRFLARSIVPHVQKLSSLFNRTDEIKAGADPAPSKAEARKEAEAEKKLMGLDPYWKKSSNPANFRLAYFLYFMPCNLYRVASVWAELARLGYQWPKGKKLKGIELGAGPASGACGIAAGEKHAKSGLPREGNWALIEQDKPMLELGSEWAREYFQTQDQPEWDIRKFHRKLELEGESLLPPAAPQFNLWVASYFLNESEVELPLVAKSLLQTWKDHLEEDGIVILVEPALRVQSRKLLELRNQLILQSEKMNHFPLQILLPCMGHQACGALAGKDDWCHEEVTWWRPPYFRVIDKMAGLDRKSLPFSYLVLTRSSKPIEEILPAFRGTQSRSRYRLVSPAHHQGRDLEFFLCGEEGKRRARYQPKDDETLERGDLIGDAEIRGDVHASRIQRLKKIGKEEA